MKGDLNTIITQHLECPICRCIFNDPKILLCAHTFCKGCLEHILESAGVDQMLVCPLCRSKIKVPRGDVNELLTNRALKFLVEDVKIQRQDGDVASGSLADVADGGKEDAAQLHPRNKMFKITHQSSTSITLKSSEEDCELSDCFKTVQELSRPEVTEVILEGTHFFPTEAKNKTIEFLRIRATRGNLQHMLHAVAQHCSALTELELTFGETSQTDPPHLPPAVCHSLKVLDLSVGHLTLANLVALLEVIAVVYPNVQRLNISVNGRFHSEHMSFTAGAGLLLPNPDILQFSSEGMDQEAERHLQQTVYAFCPQLAKTKSQDGASIFRRIHGVSGYVDHLGGEISIPAHDVKLSIPPGALEGREKISIEAFSELPNGINLQDNEVVASYGFRCFPSGLTFKKPLILSMPHCAIIDDHESIRMVLHFGTDEEEEMTRIPLELGEYVIHSERFELQLHHFSWGIATMIYNWLFPGGKSESQAAKRMMCTPFIPSTLPKDQDCPILHLRIYSQLPGLSKEILEEERSIGYVKVYPEEELLVKVDSTDMAVICELEELPGTQQREEIAAEELMQKSKRTVSFKLPKRKSMVALIIQQERKITMKFWTDIKVEEIEMEVEQQQASPLSYQAGAIAPPDNDYQILRELPLVEDTTHHPVPPGSVVRYSQYQPVSFLRRRGPGSLTDEQLVDLSREFPVDKFNAISVRLGSTMTETEDIRTTSRNTADAYFTVLTRWQERTGAPKRQLIDVLRSVKLLGIVQTMGLEYDHFPEDMD